MTEQSISYRRVSLWKHALLMLLVAMVVRAVAAIFIDGGEWLSSSTLVVHKMLEVLGAVLLPLVLAWATLPIKRPKISWAVLLVLQAYLILSVYHASRSLSVEGFESQTPPAGAPAARALLQSDPKSSVEVFAVTQSSGGVEASDIDKDFISFVEQHFIDATLQHQIATNGERGVSSGASRYTSSTVIADVHGRSYAITSLEPPVKGMAAVKIIWWIYGGKIERVACANLKGGAVAVRSGPCGAKIAEHFGHPEWIVDSEGRLPSESNKLVR